MNILDKAMQTEFLGQDFLVWLWFKSETLEGRFPLDEEHTINLWFDGRLTLQSAADDGGEVVVCQGETSQTREGRFSLNENKKVTQARLRMVLGEEEWSFALDARWLNFRSLKTPRIMDDRKDDPDGLFYEKMYLLERPVAVVNHLFHQFITLRISPEWEQEELPAMTQWLQKEMTPVPGDRLP